MTSPAELFVEPLSVLEERIEPLLARLTAHPLYSRLDSLAALRTFMTHHVFAVWDFMSLLKGLQQHLTGTQIPWRPVGDPEVRRLINQIVVEEESDVTEDGRAASHLEMYLEAMTKAGADHSSIQSLLAALGEGQDVDTAMVAASVPAAAARFCRQTFAFIEDGRPHVLAAAFTVGREEAIPRMFVSLVQNLNQQPSADLSSFVYYLQRHIELDGAHHSEQGRQMLRRLCGDDPVRWQEAYQVSEVALRARLQFWDDLLAQIAVAPSA